jgi:threonine dehydrogenase-like Zn-dependent dehydrogenase
VLREAARACRKGGILSIPGVYAGMADKFPIGFIFGKGLTIRTGQTHVHRYLDRLMTHVQNGDIDPSFVITHRMPLEQAPEAYKIFHKKQDDCIKVVLKP